MGLFDGLGGGGQVTGREAQLPEYMSPWIGGFGPQFGDNNAQVPYAAFNAPAPYLDFRGAPGSRYALPLQHGDEGYVPYGQFAGPSGQGGYLPNLGFLYGQSTENLREGTHPGLQPMESGFNPRISQAMQWMDDAVPALTPYTGDALQSIRGLLQGGPSPYSGAVNYFSGLPAPTYARGHDPLYTAGLGALGGAGRLYPSMLDPLTEGARRSALSGTVPVGTYQPVLDDITRRGQEQSADLARSFSEDVAPGLVQRLATGQVNYGSAGERMANRLARTYGEQQRRIAEDTQGRVAGIHSQAAQDALQRQFSAMGMGSQAAQNIFGQGANILQGQTGLEQATMGSQMDRALTAAGMGMGNELDRAQVGLNALPSIHQAALSPLQQYMLMGMTQRDIANAMAADQYRRDPLNLAWNDLQRYGGLINATQMPQPISSSGSSGSSTLGGVGALLSGLGAVAAPFF